MIRTCAIDTVICHHYVRPTGTTFRLGGSRSAEWHYVKTALAQGALDLRAPERPPVSSPLHTPMIRESFEGNMKALEPCFKAGLLEPNEIEAQRQLAQYLTLEVHREC